MKIAIDVLPAEVNPAGIGQYTLSIISTLFELDKENEYIIYSTKPFATDKKNVVIKKNKFLPLSGVMWMYKVAKHAKENGVDVLISPSNMLFPLLFPKTIQFIHDLGPVRFPQFFSKKGAFMYKWLVKNILPKAWKIAVVSETVKQELVEYIKIDPDRVNVIYPSINTKMLSEAVNFVDFSLPDKFFLSLTTLEPRKNIPSIIRGFGAYIDQHKDDETALVVVGKKGWYYDAIFNEVNRLNLQNRVVFMGYVPDRYITSIVKKAQALIYLSHYEGFGMPILEALNLDVPVIASDIPVFRECFNVPGVEFVDDGDKEAVAATMQKMLTEKSVVEFDKDRFTWEKSAQTLLNILNS